MPNSGNFLKAVLLTGCIAGTLDLGGAIASILITTRNFPKTILETIAGGAFGPEARAGGWSMKVWGLFFHFLIAISFALVYFLAYPNIKLIRKNIFLGAFIYGLFVWVMMNMVVLPLSAYHSPVIPAKAIPAIRAAFVLMLCVGLPVAIGAKNFYRKRINLLFQGQKSFD